jgi:hypothetical protein
MRPEEENKLGGQRGGGDYNRAMTSNPQHGQISILRITCPV